MKFQKTAVLLLFALLSLMACSSFDSEEVRFRYDDNGLQYSPTEIQGYVVYLRSLNLESVKVIGVDASLHPLDTIDALFDTRQKPDILFFASMHDYEYPIVKIVTVFAPNENEKMEFCHYVRLSQYNNQVILSLGSALMSGRIEYLVQEQGIPFDDARSQAVSESADAFLVNPYTDLQVYNYANNKANLSGVMFYIYCQHEISDSVFYSTYKEYFKAFAKTGSIDSTLLVKSADAWLSTFKVYDDEYGNTHFRSFSRDSGAGVSYCDYGFFERAYGIELSLTADDWKARKNRFVKIDKEESQFNNRMFIYDADLGYWRLQMKLEDSIGVCMYRTDSAAFCNGVYYLCDEGSASWYEDSHREVILNRMYGECVSAYAFNGNSGYFRDSLFFCECDKERNCAWTDKYVDSVFNKGDALYASALNARAAQRFGECNSVTNGEERTLDTVSVYCSWSAGYKGTWRLKDD